MRISDWSSDVCSSDLVLDRRLAAAGSLLTDPADGVLAAERAAQLDAAEVGLQLAADHLQQGGLAGPVAADQADMVTGRDGRAGVVEQDAAGDTEIGRAAWRERVCK